MSRSEAQTRKDLTDPKLEDASYFNFNFLQRIAAKLVVFND
jgi:hypothetical protein